MQREKKRGFVWTFIAGELIAYRFSGDRSGATPLQVLGGTTGTLVVDAYTRCNVVLKELATPLLWPAASEACGAETRS